MNFIDGIKQKAKTNRKLIVLPETEDLRTYQAAAMALEEGFADILLIGSKDLIEVKSKAAGVDVSKASYIDPKTTDKLQTYVDALVELRKKKGMTPELAKATLLSDYTYFAVMAMKLGDADGMVSGCCHSSANTIRPALQILKTSDEAKLVSAFFVVDVPDCDLGDNGVFIFADSGLNQDPTSEELAYIARDCEKSWNLLVGSTAKVAMLSHSTKGSAQHELVTKMVEATRIAHALFPKMRVDGELQLDAAIIPEVALSKAPGSDVAGQANILIFPNLDAGNIGYKLVQRLGKAEAYGPLLQGISKPVNDLSRGCSASDFAGVIAITAVQAQLAEEEAIRKMKENE